MSLPRVLAACALALLPIVPACTCSQRPNEQSGTMASASGSAMAASSASASSSVELSQPDPDIKPVYPPLSGPPHPLAQKFCDAVQSVPARRRAECCSSAVVPAVLLSECVRNLSGALSSGAVTIEEADIGRCQASMESLYKGCDWVQPPPFGPPPPAACLGLFHGTRKAGSACRSNLECEGAQVCLGLGPTTVGRCSAAHEAGPCGPAVDALAIYARQTDVEQQHPACTGWCDRKQCAQVHREGEKCSLHESCGPGHHCSEGVCRAGSEGKEGEKCLGTRCATGLNCEAGKCVAPRAEGAACERDQQCRGKCVHKGGDGADATKGMCVAQCALPSLDDILRRGKTPPVKTPGKTPAR